MLAGDIDDFVGYLQNNRRLSAHTVSNYKRDLAKLLLFCAEREIDDTAQLQTGDVRDFIAREHRRGLSGRSIQRLLSAVRSLYRYLNSMHGLKHNPAVGIQAPKAARLLPKAAEVDELQHFLNMPTDSWIGCRDNAMFELLYSSGLRLDELVSLNITELHLNEGRGEVRVSHGKGDKARVVPIGRVARTALTDWLKRRAERATPEQQQAVFISQRGQRISPRSVQARLRYWSQRQGLRQNLHPHMLRHSFASHLLQSSGELRALQEMLGHANISTTQVYTHLDYQHLAAVYDKAHPRAKGKK
ncbi:MAG: tyrosine recombinase XerC [Pseudomonadales bacterium]